MINWTKIKDDVWIITKNERVFNIHTLEKLFVYSLAMGIEIDEIEFALLEMERNNHTKASFGVWNTFICSE